MPHRIPKALLHSTPMDPRYREAYNKDLAASIGFKLFWLSHVPLPEVLQFVDLGCGNGALLSALHAMLGSGPEYIGIDNDIEQLNAASRRFPFASYKQFGVGDRPGKGGGKSCLIMSSVLHEIWSTPGFNLAEFWGLVEEEGFDYIVLRDFGLPQWTFTRDTPHEWLDAIAGTFELADLLGDFEAKYGPISFMAEAIHFLMKSEYRGNWAREMDEDYFRISREQVLYRMIASGRYEATHAAATVTPHFRKRCDTVFGIALPCCTHLEVVLTKRK